MTPPGSMGTRAGSGASKEPLRDLVDPPRVRGRGLSGFLVGPGSHSNPTGPSNSLRVGGRLRTVISGLQSVSHPRVKGGVPEVVRHSRDGVGVTDLVPNRVSTGRLMFVSSSDVSLLLRLLPLFRTGFLFPESLGSRPARIKDTYAPRVGRGTSLVSRLADSCSVVK